MSLLKINFLPGCHFCKPSPGLPAPTANTPRPGSQPFFAGANPALPLAPLHCRSLVKDQPSPIEHKKRDENPNPQNLGFRSSSRSFFRDLQAAPRKLTGLPRCLHCKYPDLCSGRRPLAFPFPGTVTKIEVPAAITVASYLCRILTGFLTMRFALY